MFLRNIDKPYAQMIILGLLLAFNGYHLCAVYGALTHIKEWYYYIPVAFAGICVEVGIFYATRNEKKSFVYGGAFIASLFNIFYVIVKDIQSPPEGNLLSAPSIQYWGAIVIGFIISAAFGCMPIYFAEYLNSSINEELQGVESENETILALQQELASLTKDLATLDNLKNNLSKAESDLANTRQSLSERETELATTKEKLTESDKKLAELLESSATFDNKQLKLDNALSELDKLKEKLAKAVKDLAKANEDLSKANKELTGLRSKADFVALNGDISYEQYAAAINKITQNKGKEDFIPNILVHKSELPKVIEFSKPKTK